MATLSNARRVVVKVGSALLVDRTTEALRRDWLIDLAADVADLPDDVPDIDSDGDLDVVAGTADGVVLFFAGDGAGGFVDPADMVPALPLEYGEFHTRLLPYASTVRTVEPVVRRPSRARWASAAWASG